LWEKKEDQGNKVDLERRNYFVEKMEGVMVIDVAGTINPNFHLVGLVPRLRLVVVVDEIEDSNEDLVHVVDELISRNED
jgi:hypothetical protein